MRRICSEQSPEARDQAVDDGHRAERNVQHRAEPLGLRHAVADGWKAGVPGHADREDAARLEHTPARQLVPWRRLRTMKGIFF